MQIARKINSKNPLNGLKIKIKIKKIIKYK